MVDLNVKRPKSNYNKINTKFALKPIFSCFLFLNCIAFFSCIHLLSATCCVRTYVRMLMCVRVCLCFCAIWPFAMQADTHTLTYRPHLFNNKSRALIFPFKVIYFMFLNRFFFVLEWICIVRTLFSFLIFLFFINSRFYIYL